MPNYNYFGLKYQDVVNAFRGAVANDFGGQAIIEAEMELVEAEIVAQLSRKALSMMSNVEYQELPQISGMSYTMNPPYLQDLYVYEVGRYNPALNNTVDNPLPGICCNPVDCSNIKKELDSTYLFTDYTVSDSTITFGNTFDQDTNTYYISYTADVSALDFPSLKSILRDRVACTLGMQLYSRGDDTWSLVGRYCERGDKMLEAIDEHWLPAEFRKNKYLNNPFTIKGGISSIRFSRS